MSVSVQVSVEEQVQVLVEKGYPGLAGLREPEFRGLFAPLHDLVTGQPVVVVVPRSLVPLEQMAAATALGTRTGFTSMEPGDLARFVPTPEVGQVSEKPYLIVDPDTGAETLGVRPNDALPGILASGRTPLTVDEGLAVVTQHPQWLAERNCFEMLGSRAGDKRVTGLWLSAKRPRLGWCWAGNPHSWLGMATAQSRVAT